MEKLIGRLQKDFKDIRFVKADRFCWSPADKAVAYTNKNGLVNQWALLHELAHALLGHKNYETDFELLLMEAAAWEKAKSLAEKYKITISEDHIQDCLDTYRDWLYSRSNCPDCINTGIQLDERHYRCHNCLKIWRVSKARFKRPYRLGGNDYKKSSQPTEAVTTFV